MTSFTVNTVYLVFFLLNRISPPHIDPTFQCMYFRVKDCAFSIAKEKYF